MYNYIIIKSSFMVDTPILQRFLQVWGFFCETTSPKAKRIGLGKLMRLAENKRSAV